MLRRLCNCNGDDSHFIDNIIWWQKVGDFGIVVAYFFIPLELLYFMTCSTRFPFKWVVIQFSAFIVLCGMTHLLTLFTFEPHSFVLILALTIFKFFTALVSFATAITLLTLIPQLLRVKLRESYLRTKALELDRKVGMLRRQEAASWHVRMVTQEIRKSLNKHTILYTTLVELSKTLGLQTCAVWMPDVENQEMNLTHELNERNSIGMQGHSVSINDPEVTEITKSKGVRLLNPNSFLGTVTTQGELKPGVAAIRMPILKESDLNGGMPKTIETCYAILVLVLPEDFSGDLSCHEREIIEVVADQVPVALSHAAVLEESQKMRDKLAKQNSALHQARQDALMASDARNSFQMAVSQGLRKPVHSIVGLLSMLKQENLNPEQSLIVNAMAKTSGVISKLVDSVVDTSGVNSKKLTLEMEPFELHSTIKDAVSVASCLCRCRGIGFDFKVDFTVMNHVIGDEKLIFHVILHMIGILLMRCEQGILTFHISRYNEVEKCDDKGWFPWKSKFSEGYAYVKFEIKLERPEPDGSIISLRPTLKSNSKGLDLGLRFNVCKRLVEMMRGSIKAFPNSQGTVEKISLVLPFQLRSLPAISDMGTSSEYYHTPPAPNFRGLRVLLADNDNTNRAVTRKLLEKLGFHVTSFSSGSQCLNSFATLRTSSHLLILDMESFEVASRIQNLRTGGWPLIVVLTAKSGDEWDRCLLSGVNGLIQKPVTLQGMREELSRVLHNI